MLLTRILAIGQCQLIREWVRRLHCIGQELVHIPLARHLLHDALFVVVSNERKEESNQVQ